MLFSTPWMYYYYACFQPPPGAMVAWPPPLEGADPTVPRDEESTLPIWASGLTVWASFSACILGLGFAKVVHAFCEHLGSPPCRWYCLLMTASLCAAAPGRGH